MKKTIKSIFTLVMCLMVMFSFASCKDGNIDKDETDNVQVTSLWDKAKYTEDTEIGEGETVFTLKVEAEEKSIVFTVKTDKNIVGEALAENEIVSGEEGPYGLYITHVNGIRAVYEEDGAYWGFMKDGEYMNTGVDQTEIENNAQYELVYTKG